MKNKMSRVVECGVFVICATMVATSISLLVDKALECSEKKKWKKDIKYISGEINKMLKENEAE